MRMNKSVSFVTVGLAFLSLSTLAHADDIRKVVTLSDKKPVVYERQGDVFKRAGKIEASAIALPATVADESPKGYVQVQSSGGLVWLDMMDVTIQPNRKTTKGLCSTLPGQTVDTTLAAVRGAGERNCP